MPVQKWVPGEVVNVREGDMVPVDVRVVAAKDLFVTQSALTGESLPVEKFATPQTTTAQADVTPLEFANICFLGKSGESGAATGADLAAGARACCGGEGGPGASEAGGRNGGDGLVRVGE